ncbi:hypothetical protein FRB95_009234, partial [Tulasnella sp. JGI-2019a]
HNIPKDLVTLIRGISHESILDFSLGSSGRYYIKWKDPQGVVKQNVSRGLWEMIRQKPDTILDRLSLGSGNAHWGVTRNGRTSFCQVERKISETVLEVEAKFGLSSIPFISLGAVDSFCYQAAGSIYLDDLAFELKAKLRIAIQAGRTIANVVRSPHGTTTWVIMCGDGGYYGTLPENWAKDLDLHAQPQYSLLLRPAQSLSASLVTLRPLQQPPIQPSKAVRPFLSSSPEFLELQRLFMNGWKHFQKGCPSVVNVCAIDLTVALSRSYEAYRLQLEQQLGQQQLDERKVFHGTLRRCCIGDPPNKTQLCDESDCSMCSIIRVSFQLDRAGTAPGRNFMRFGRGIYTTSVSSKADDYNISQKPSSSRHKAVLMARVVLGLGYPLYTDTTTLTGAPGGYNSVIGKVGMLVGVGPNHDEQVVYRDDAIRPAYIVVYQL